MFVINRLINQSPSWAESINTLRSKELSELSGTNKLFRYWFLGYSCLYCLMLVHDLTGKNIYIIYIKSNKCNKLILNRYIKKFLNIKKIKIKFKPSLNLDFLENKSHCPINFKFAKNTKTVASNWICPHSSSINKVCLRFLNSWHLKCAVRALKWHLNALHMCKLAKLVI